VEAVGRNSARRIVHWCRCTLNSADGGLLLKYGEVKPMSFALGFGDFDAVVAVAAAATSATSFAVAAADAAAAAVAATSAAALMDGNCYAVEV
jgi:hypothetical protein